VWGLGCEAATKKSGATDSAGASCHGHAGQGQATARPAKSQRPHLEDCVSWDSGCREPEFPTKTLSVHAPCQNLSVTRFWHMAGLFVVSVEEQRLFRRSVCRRLPAQFRGSECSILPHTAAFCCGRCAALRCLYDSRELEIRTGSKQRLSPSAPQPPVSIRCYPSNVRFIRRSSL